MWMILATVVFLAYLWVKHYFSYFKRKGFPYVPAKFPQGSMNGVGTREHTSTFMKREFDRLKHKAPAFGLFFLTRKTIVPTDPELVKDIFVRNFESFHDHGFPFNEKADPLSVHLFSTNGQVWKDLRAKLSPTFTSGRMKMMFPLVASKADRMIEFLKSQVGSENPIEMKEIFASYTTESIASVAFGLETKVLGEDGNEFRKHGRRVFEPTTWDNVKLFIMLSFDKISRLLNLGLNEQDTIDFFMGTVRETLEYRQKNNVQRNDFFQLAMEVMKDDKDFQFNELASNCFLFFLAGFETSSSVSTFMVYELALNPDIQERLRDEINEVLEHHNGEVTYDAIMEMKYLDIVFNETTRRWPLVDSHFRMCTKDFQIPNSDLVIEAGTFVMVPAIGFHLDERYWDEPEKFDPERFNEWNAKKIVPFTFFPFSEGPRICIGMRFGTMQTKLGIVKLLQNFRLSTCSKTLIPMELMPAGNVQTPKGGMWLKVEKI